MTIDRCVLYLTSANPMTRISAMETDGKGKIPITLPFVKCLEDLTHDGEQKYQPYVFKEAPEVFVRISEPLFVNGLTIRQRKAYEMHKGGVSTEDIARSMKTSSSSVRRMIFVAKTKLETNTDSGEANV